VPVTSEPHGDHVLVVTIDRQERRNAVDREAVEALKDLAGSTTARVLVLTGAGGHFCSGADLTTLEDAAFAALVRSACEALGRPDLVTIAACAGAALGAGTKFAVACELRVAKPDAKFGVPAGKLGVVLDRLTVARISALAGAGAARAMLLGGEVLSGEDAHRLGFVQRLGGLDDAVAWADAIAGLAPLTLAGHKLALEQPDDAAANTAAYDRAWSSADLAEGLAAFQEKRPPRFEGR
jgi:enoyl-CoA hydratase